MRIVLVVMATALIVISVASYLGAFGKSEPQSPIGCDLAKNSCSVTGGGLEAVVADMGPRPLMVDGTTTITITGLPPSVDDPKIRIAGLNMDMGTVITSLNLQKDGSHKASVALAACVVESVMYYRILLYNGNESLGAYAEFSLAR